MPSKSKHLVVHSLHCTACDAEKTSITMELCPTCEQAMLRHFPGDYFKCTKYLEKEESLEACALVVQEALATAASDPSVPAALAA